MLRKLTGIILAVVLMGVGLTGCGNAADTNSDSKGTIKLPYVNWADSVAITYLAAAVLEDKMGYTVELTMADPGPLFASVANGGSDAYLDVWLPVTHENYIDEFGDDMVDLGIVYEDASNALVVPAYVDIDSIDELNAKKDEFGGEIIGIDSGSGLMGITEKVIQEYDLDYRLQSGSDATMTAALGKAIDANKPIVVTGWAPHWMFSKWDLKVLEDPKGAFGAGEEVHKYVRKDLEKDMPDVTEFIKKFKLTKDDLAELMEAIEDGGGEPMEATRSWMNSHEDLVNGWIN